MCDLLFEAEFPNDSPEEVRKVRGDCILRKRAALPLEHQGPIATVVRCPHVPRSVLLCRPRQPQRTDKGAATQFKNCLRALHLDHGIEPDAPVLGAIDKASAIRK